jgi:hypothetical protein
MTRARFAAPLAVLALLLLPSTAVATPIPGTLDQEVLPGEGSTYLADWNVTQRFTAGLTGELVLVELYCFSDVGLPAAVTVTLGSSTATGACGDTVAWVPIFFGSTPPDAAGRAVAAGGPIVVAGQHYTITFGSPTPTHWGVAASNYAGGAAAAAGEPIQDVTDFAFRTYVNTSVTPPPTSAFASAGGSDAGSPLWLLVAVWGGALVSLVVLRRSAFAPKR